MKQMLPIGSIVLLKNAKKRVMVCGRVQHSLETQKCYDYAGCVYPEGLIDSRNMILFNNDDITKLFFIGFQDGEELRFRQAITKLEEQGVLGNEVLKENESN